MSEEIIKNSRELKQFVQATLNDIKEGVGSEFYIDGAIKFEVAVVKVKEGSGGFRIYVVNAGGKYNKEEISKISFKVRKKSNISASAGGRSIFYRNKESYI